MNKQKSHTTKTRKLYDFDREFSEIRDSVNMCFFYEGFLALPIVGIQQYKSKWKVVGLGRVLEVV